MCVLAEADCDKDKYIVQKVHFKSYERCQLILGLACYVEHMTREGLRLEHGRREAYQSHVSRHDVHKASINCAKALTEPQAMRCCDLCSE